MKKILKKVASKYVNSLARVLSGDGHDEKEDQGENNFKGNPKFEKEGSLIVGRLPGYFLIFLVIAAFYLTYIVIEPFFPTLLIASVLTILFYPVYRKIHEKLRGMKRTASLLTCFIVFLVLIIPLALLGILLVKEGISMYQTISEKFASGYFDDFFRWQKGNWLFDLKDQLSPVINLDNLDIKGMILNAAQTVSAFLVSQGAALAANIGVLILHAIVTFFSMFYLFMDGDKFIKKFTILSPLPKKYEQRIFERINVTVKAIAFGVFLTAIIQGVCAGIGYVIAGIPNPVFWAFVTGVFSLIPLIGTSAVWVPAVIILLVLGNYASGIFLLLWGIMLVGTIDNFVGPYLVSSKSKMYPLLTFFVVAGGVFVFGMQGLVFGPLVLVLLLTLLHVYELEYKHVLGR